MARRRMADVRTDRERVLATLDYETWRSPSEVSERTGLPHYRARGSLRSLKYNGLVESAGKTKGTRYRLARRVKSPITLAMPELLETYFRFPIHPVTIKGAAEITGVPLSTLFKYVRELMVAGLIEKDPAPTWPKGKPVYRYRRVYNAITFNVDGTVIGHNQPVRK